jgi:hypothetical protein
LQSQLDPAALQQAFLYFVFRFEISFPLAFNLVEPKLIDKVKRNF